VSIDHSVVRELTDAGAIIASTARFLPIRNILTRALIAGADHPPDIWLLPMVSGDRILVCSDGLTGQVDDQYNQNVLRTTVDAQMAADKLVNAAVDVTALVIDAVTVGAPCVSGAA
jgi:protein phosphatase